MNIAVQDDIRAGFMTVVDFREFLEHRPEQERWELVAGVPMMMVPPKLAHNRIASNLERLLNDALDNCRPELAAHQRAGLQLQADAYAPEPDVCVIDGHFDIDQRYIERAYLLAEIVSSTDEFMVPGRRSRWIDVKRDLYRAHAPCEAILIVQQHEIAIEMDVRTPDGWQSHVLGAQDELHLPGFGLRCATRDLYRRTPLNPRITPP